VGEGACGVLWLGIWRGAFSRVRWFGDEWFGEWSDLMVRDENGDCVIARREGCFIVSGSRIQREECDC